MKKDSDEGVSVVVALMLILAIISICIAAYTTTYIPGLKQQDEITKSDDIRYAFERFSSDVDNIISLGREASFSETFPLGGGGVALSPSKSSGSVELTKEKIGTLTVDSYSHDIYSVSVKYNPLYSTWEPQGYLYNRGVVWITKGGNKIPSGQRLYTTADGEKEENNTVKYWLDEKKSNNVITYYTMDIDEAAGSVTGSGFAKLKLNAEITKEYGSYVLSDRSVSISGINGFFESYQIPQSSSLKVRLITVTVSVE